MSEVNAILKYARVGEQKARLVANLVRGKNVNEAIGVLKKMNWGLEEKLQFYKTRFLKNVLLATFSPSF